MQTMFDILFLSLSILRSHFSLLVPSLSVFRAIINSTNANRVTLKLACRVCDHGNRAKHTALTKPLIYRRRGFTAPGLCSLCTQIHTDTHTQNQHSHTSEVACQAGDRDTERVNGTELIDGILCVCVHVCVHAQACVHMQRERESQTRERKHLHFNTCTLHVQKTCIGETCQGHLLACLQHVHIYICVHLSVCACVHVVPFNPFL